ncbi:hypothetical protein ACJJIX_08460 [Microbulbifer sp. VAAC004]|uniref:hypothetical protein n=1 Tax=unclassified Microbulbifer TaxID=2619833 RepID=UPI00403A66CE
MDKKLLGLLPGTGIYVYILATQETLTVSSVFGWLAYSIAIGSMIFFVMFAPYGKQSSFTVFGREQRYRTPVPIIPMKVALSILGVIVASLTISFVLYHISQ